MLVAAGAGAASMLGSAPAISAVNSKSSRLSSEFAQANSKFNILFILTDQERYFRPGELPVGYSLLAHEQLRRRGTTFVNHHINSCVCTPSRSVVYTGQHIQHTRMFDNTNF